MSDRRRPELSLIIPTLRERENLKVLLPGLLAVAGENSISLQVIIVDDGSDDGTAEEAERLLESPPHIVVRRQAGSGSLAGSVVDGLALAEGEFIGVMDADLSHDINALVSMLRAGREGTDLVVASRYVPGGSCNGWPLVRRLSSLIACMMARWLVPFRDGVSGFFLFRRSVTDGLELSVPGFKIGLDIFVRGNWSSAREFPYRFIDRGTGSSKFGRTAILAFAGQWFRLVLAYPFGSPSLGSGGRLLRLTLLLLPLVSVLLLAIRQ